MSNLLDFYIHKFTAAQSLLIVRWRDGIALAGLGRALVCLRAGLGAVAAVRIASCDLFLYIDLIS